MPNGVPNVWRAGYGYCQAMGPPLMGYGMMPQHFGMHHLYPGAYPPNGYLPSNGYFIPVLTEMPVQKKSKKSKSSSNSTPGFKFLARPDTNVRLMVFAPGTKAAVIASGLSLNEVPSVNGYTVPSMTTFKELVTNLGAPEGSVVYNVHEMGNGRWGKGARIDTIKDDGKKALADVGYSTEKPNWVIVEAPKKKG